MYSAAARIVFEKLRRTSVAIGLLSLCIVSTILLCFLMDTIEFPKLREPKPLSGGAWLYPIASPLLDLPRFKYLLNNDVCQELDNNINNKVRAVILITSHAGDIRARSIRRNAFPFSELRRLQLRRVFLLATATKNQTGYKYVKQEVIIAENNKYHDIIQGNFQEAYRNLSYKHAMGLKWASTYCSSVKYIIKMDDDIAVNIYALLDILNKYDLQGSIAGYVLKGMKPDRGTSKWKVSHEEWPEEYYPTFVSGWLYATSPVSARKLVSTLENSKVFWIDDVLVTGVAREKAKVGLVDISTHFALHAERIHCCLQSFECDFVIAPSYGDWDLLEHYLKYVAKTSGRLPMQNVKCVVAGSSQVLPISQGMGKSKAIQLR